jgi:hypothetical protein
MPAAPPDTLSNLRLILLGFKVGDEKDPRVIASGLNLLDLPNEACLPLLLLFAFPLFFRWGTRLDDRDDPDIGRDSTTEQCIRTTPAYKASKNIKEDLKFAAIFLSEYFLKY